MIFWKTHFLMLVFVCFMTIFILKHVMLVASIAAAGGNWLIAISNYSSLIFSNCAHNRVVTLKTSPSASIASCREGITFNKKSNLFTNVMPYNLKFYDAHCNLSAFILWHCPLGPITFTSFRSTLFIHCIVPSDQLHSLPLEEHCLYTALSPGTNHIHFI